MDNNNDLTDETIRKIARNQADKILEWTREPGCINTNTGKLWTPEELSTYWKECYAKEVIRVGARINKRSIPFGVPLFPKVRS